MNVNSYLRTLRGSTALPRLNFFLTLREREERKDWMRKWAPRSATSSDMKAAAEDRWMTEVRGGVRHLAEGNSFVDSLAEYLVGTYRMNGALTEFQTNCLTNLGDLLAGGRCASARQTIERGERFIP